MGLSIEVRAAAKPGLFVAHVCGPWYSSSEPQGIAPTREEAIRLAVEQVREMRDAIDSFLKEHDGCSSSV